MKTQKLASGTIRVDAACYLLELRPKDALAYLAVKGTHQKYLFFPGGACNPMGSAMRRGGSVRSPPRLRTA